jgi:hypothetical protein
LLEIAIEEYRNAIYQFKEPLKPWSNFGANKSYETKVLQNLTEIVLKKGMILGFPDLKGNGHLHSNKNYSGGEQALLMNYT